MCQYRRSEAQATFDPKQCPFTLRQLNPTTFLVREHDRFVSQFPVIKKNHISHEQGEFPHIYVKMHVHISSTGQKSKVIVINDTGVGTNVLCNAPNRDGNIADFIGHHFNLDGDIPYLVILSHCHYDHILGLEQLLHSSHHEIAATTPSRSGQNVTIASSSCAQSFATPYEVLMEHSLCTSEKLLAPVYQTSIWAQDGERIVYNHPSGVDMDLSILTLHTAGHTPDSLSWYDIKERTLYVGDSFYAQESSDTRDALWGPEGPASILFPNEGSVVDWWRSLGKLVAFVDEKNQEEGAMVKLAAGHVTADADAEAFLRNVKQFMAKVLRKEVDFEEMPPKRGERFGLWTLKVQDDVHSFSLGAPLRLVEEGRGEIHETEWVA
jgi:glyoxylase-like metal-dependent hydrolase (beta-lactamase superfamily II)